MAAVAAMGVLALAACSTAIERSYTDPTPDARVGALSESMASGRRSDAPHMVENLESDDPAVRMAAAHALNQLTGTTLGYRASAPQAERDEAISRWKEWLRKEGLLPQRPAPTADTMPRHGVSPT